MRTAGAVALALLAGYLMGHHAGLSDAAVPPLCEEDETVLVDGRCWPVDDSDYVGGVGWVVQR